MSAARRVCQIACIGAQTFTERKTAYDQREGIATVCRALTVLVAAAEQHKQKKIVHNYHLTNKIRRIQTKNLILPPLYRYIICSYDDIYAASSLPEESARSQMNTTSHKKRLSTYRI